MFITSHNIYFTPTEYLSTHFYAFHISYGIVKLFRLTDSITLMIEEENSRYVLLANKNESQHVL